MGFVGDNMVGKHRIVRSIGEGSFAKVKLAIHTTNGTQAAVKIINKRMVMDNNLKYQVKREITTMKLLHHPNIVRIFEVIGSKTKIYIVMEYVSGGQLSDQLSYVKRFSETEARKIFQQLIHAVDHCHAKGVYHRDLKPENLLLDSKGNLKVSDFGLSALRKPGDLLTTACGSPCYVAPELIANKGYEGAAADIWSCGVILFEMLAGFLPFDDQSLMALYRKICKADYSCPPWFTEMQKKLLSRILVPDATRRITIQEIMEDPWFQIDYEPSSGYVPEENINLDDVSAAFDSVEEDSEKKVARNSRFINAFQLIAMSNDLNLSGLFEGQDGEKKRARLGSKLPVDETLQRIEAAAKDVRLSVQRMNDCKIKVHPEQKMTRSARSSYDFLAEVIEVSPTNCVIEISKSEGQLTVYREFCKSLSNLLTTSGEGSPLQQSNSEETKNMKMGS